ncbi:c3f88ded-357e-40e0-a59d-15362acc3e62 [Sclerotinia trifoliorum]|uniref:C3f88ded-357e-40e0-a59d-15362acc3e62 n=1 Tax=Sclerotinia trifoliorum TaxID=28548 RepID=A0A8H2W7H1_9HELO|nr:c3f88ded-357e-40e0-a59d-15362acc3e62 [Sclerotinia trifoliorum]
MESNAAMENNPIPAAAPPEMTLNIKSRLFSPITSIRSIGIPQLGFGVYDCHGQKCIDAVSIALKTGYRHIDTAQYYGNEKEVGFAIKEYMKESGLKRHELFITTKILTPGGSVDKSHEKCLDSIKALDDSLRGYVDLFLIHSPNCGADSRLEMWEALERLFKKGKARLIGVSNFGVGHIEGLKRGWRPLRWNEFSEIIWPPHVNQIELHPFCQQRTVVEYCTTNGIHVEAYCPLVRNQRSDDTVLNGIATLYDKTVAQVLIRYSMQKKWIPLPKSETPSRIAENADVFNFQLSDWDMYQIDSLDEGDRGSIVQAVTNEFEDEVENRVIPEFKVEVMNMPGIE